MMQNVAIVLPNGEMASQASAPLQLQGAQTPMHMP
jgi:hypothetical protein